MSSAKATPRGRTRQQALHFRQTRCSVLPSITELKRQAITTQSAPMYHALADIVLLLHLGVVVFVVGGLAAIPLGYVRGWLTVQGWRFRLLHLLAIGVVAGQSWLGIVCPLTTLESWLRVRSGAPAYETGFIEHWVHAVLFYQAPTWVFTLLYTGFATLVCLAWLRYPPRSRARALQSLNGASTEPSKVHPTRSSR